jgi:hypothetical protein
MKQMKMLGLAAIAAAGLMAFLEAGTASATVLCETTPAAGTDCPEGWAVARGTKVVFSLDPGSSSLTTGPFGEVINTCTEASLEGSGSTAGSTTQTAVETIEKVTISGCVHPNTVNTATTGTLEVHHIAGSDNGTITSNDYTQSIHGIPLFGTCSYVTSNTDVGTLTGTSVTKGAPTFDIAATLTHEPGTQCPNATWEGKFVYTGSTNFNVAAG